MTVTNLQSSLKNAFVIAHRGASGYEPENTLSAFAKASKMGAKWVELDVMLSKDGTPVVFHDETLERLTDGSGRLDEYNYNELAKLKVKGKEKIPSLKEVLAFIFQNKMKVNLEIKPSRAELAYETAKKAFEVVKFFSAVDDGRVLFSSFDYQSLETIRALSSSAYIGVLIDGNKEQGLFCASEIKAVSLNCSNEDATPDFIAKVLDNNLELLVYTVNEKARAEELLELGVCAVFSDLPDLMQ